MPHRPDQKTIDDLTERYNQLSKRFAPFLNRYYKKYRNTRRDGKNLNYASKTFVDDMVKSNKNINKYQNPGLFAKLITNNSDNAKLIQNEIKSIHKTVDLLTNSLDKFEHIIEVLERFSIKTTKFTHDLIEKLDALILLFHEIGAIIARLKVKDEKITISLSELNKREKILRKEINNDNEIEEDEYNKYDKRIDELKSSLNELYSNLLLKYIQDLFTQIQTKNGQIDRIDTEIFSIFHRFDQLNIPISNNKLIIRKLDNAVLTHNHVLIAEINNNCVNIDNQLNPINDYKTRQKNIIDTKNEYVNESQLYKMKTDSTWIDSSFTIDNKINNLIIYKTEMTAIFFNIGRKLDEITQLRDELDFNWNIINTLNNTNTRLIRQIKPAPPPPAPPAPPAPAPAPNPALAIAPAPAVALAIAPAPVLRPPLNRPRNQVRLRPRPLAAPAAVAPPPPADPEADPEAAPAAKAPAPPIYDNQNDIYPVLLRYDEDEYVFIKKSIILTKEAIFSEKINSYKPSKDNELIIISDSLVKLKKEISKNPEIVSYGIVVESSDKNINKLLNEVCKITELISPSWTLFTDDECTNGWLYKVRYLGDINFFLENITYIRV